MATNQLSTQSRRGNIDIWKKKTPIRMSHIIKVLGDPRRKISITTEDPLEEAKKAKVEE